MLKSQNCGLEAFCNTAQNRPSTILNFLEHLQLSHIYLDDTDRGSQKLSEIHTILADYEHPEKQVFSVINRFEVKVGTEVVKMH